MLGNLFRFALFLLLLGAGAILLQWLLAQSDPVTLLWQNWQLETELRVVLIGAAALVIGGWLLLATLFGVIALPRQLGRTWERHRKSRGLVALGRSLDALAASDGKAAATQARRAERLLRDPRVTRSLVATSLQVGGTQHEARTYFEALAANPATAVVGERGLLAASRDAKDLDAALRHARNWARLRPRQAAAHREVFDLLTRNGRWQEARDTLVAGARSQAWSKGESRRLEAACHVAEAFDRLADDARPSALAAARRSVELDAHNVTAACLAGRLLKDDGDKAGAERLLRRAWRANPHPEIAQLWMQLPDGDETAEAARRRRLRLADVNPAHPESKLLAAEAEAAVGDWTAARNALGNLPETAPTARAAALMAAIEKAAGEPAAARKWLVRALGAGSERILTCGSCGTPSTSWMPLCPGCGRFATLGERSISTEAANRPEPSRFLAAKEQARPPGKPEIPPPRPSAAATPVMTAPDSHFLPVRPDA